MAPFDTLLTPWAVGPGWFDVIPSLIAAGLALLHIVICAVALGVIPGNRKPSTGMAWLVLVLAVPYLGFALFLLFGSTAVNRRRLQKQAEANQVIRERTAAVAELPETEPGLAYISSVASLNRNLGGLPPLSGHNIEFYDDYVASLTAMVKAIDSAEHFVNAQFYITTWDHVTEPVFAAMVRATERGIPVRLLYDHIGSRGIPAYKETLRRLAETTIVSQAMMPVRPLHGRLSRPDLRNHRKILVVDGRVGLMGSQNLIEPSYDKPKNQELGREWVDLTLTIEGPVVAALNAVFVTDWYSETDEILHDQRMETLDVAPASATATTCQVVPSGPGFSTENNLRMFNTLLYSAHHRISITSPYFVPDESLLYAVTTAAQRGVAVELFVGAEGDQFMVHHAQRSYYQALLEAGVRIFLYPGPYVLHAKHLTVDDDVAVIGSSNMDMRSFALNYEVSLMLLGPDVVDRMKKVEDRYRELSRELTREEWGAEGRSSRYVDNVMRLTAALQ